MKKILKILIILLAVVVLVFAARKIYYSNVKIEPEELYLTKENSVEEFKATKGSYSWNDKGISVIADSIGPLQMDFSKAIDVKINEKIYFSDQNWTNGGSAVILAKERTEVARVTLETNLEENYIVMPELTKGEYVIQINLESDKGDVWYAAKINITE